MRFICDQGCVVERTKKNPPPRVCPDHGSPFVYEKELRRTRSMNRASEGNQAKERQRGSTLKQGRGFAASKAQQHKVKGLPCILCGRDGYEATMDPAHVYPRRLTPCECADGVVPLCRACHKLYDDQNEHVDLLPALVNRGYRVEMVHAVVAHEIPLRDLMEQITGVKWAPVEESTYNQEVREAVA